MNVIDEVLTRLRRLGHEIGEPYVQACVGSVGGRMYVIVDGVAMTNRQVTNLSSGRLTLEQIRGRNEQKLR